MIIRVLLLAFRRPGDKPEYREVEIPDTEFTGEQGQDLSKVFYYGQNDFQPRDQRSVSVGDVIIYGDNNYRVESSGFSRVYATKAKGFVFEEI